jgi:multicomponent Na+:H+ antiporter subunit D
MVERPVEGGGRTMPEHLPPFVLFFLGALVLPFLPRVVRGWAFLLPPLGVLWLLSGLESGTSLSLSFLLWELEPLRVDRLSLLFGWVFAMAAFVGGVYALHLRDTGQQVSALLYAGSALGAVFAGDLLTLFVFWEVMALTSAYLVWARRTDVSRASGMRYIYVHLMGGAILLAGIVLHGVESGSLAFGLFETRTTAAWLILVGFALNAAVPPLHAWLADAYPEATVTGAVFMSAFTTKTAVYALARGFWGWEILVPAGVVMALYGVVYAVLSDDIRRLLAYHIVSQVGYMVAGVGLGTAMGLNGATAHAFTHILYKGLLFMGAGVVLHATGKSKLSELGGLARYMPWTVALYMIGAFSISGFPLWSGFVSKSITVEAAELLSRENVVLLLHLASIGTFLHTGLKLPYFTWWGPKRNYDPKPIPWNMVAAMAIAAFLNTWIGLFPGGLYSILPFGIDYEPYTYSHVMKSAQLLGFTFLAFWVFRSKLGGEALIALDTDWVYRRSARASYVLGPEVVAAAFGVVERGLYGVMGRVVQVGRDPVGWLERAKRVGKDVVASSPGTPEGGDPETASTTLRISMAAGVILVLTALLIFFLRIVVPPT